MAENNKKLFTESFEKVVNTFYDTAEAANVITESSIHAEEIGTFARDITKEFSGSGTMKEFSGDEDTAPSNDDQPVTGRVDQTGMPQKTEQVSPSVPVTIADSPEPLPQSPASEEYQQVFGIPKIPFPQMYAVAGLNPNSQDKQDTFNEVYLRTSNTTHAIAFEWALENFSRYVDEVHSSVFSAESCETTWQASIAILSNQEEKAERLELYMTATSELQQAVQAHFSLGVYNKLGESFDECITKAKFTRDRRVHQCLVTKGPYAENKVMKGQNLRPHVRIYDDEVIIKGSIQVTGCCVRTLRSSEPKLMSR